MNSTVVIILIAMVLLVLAIIAFLVIRRQRYVRALRGRGWRKDLQITPPAFRRMPRLMS